jgi:hypothetical protein
MNQLIFDDELFFQFSSFHSSSFITIYLKISSNSHCQAIYPSWMLLKISEAYFKSLAYSHRKSP